jgi:hypothetical protein
MGSLRYCLVNVLIAVIVVGSLFDLVSRKEHWPFSPYEMYSGIVRNRSLTLLRLYGVLQGKPGEEIPLFEFQFIQPFDNSRLRFALARLDRDENREQLLPEALRDLLSRYAALGFAARHSGPPLEGLRLYRVYWKLDPSALNVNLPDKKELLSEVSNLVMDRN